MQQLIDADGELFVCRQYYAPPVADALFAQLLHGLAWQEENIVIAGRSVKVPRLVCWYGDPDAVYRYSGVEHRPLPWIDTLAEIKRRIGDDSGYRFNSVLANLYRDGNDSMGWHADKEKELGQNPVIASLSFGDTRLFKIRHIKNGKTLDIDLDHGDLLIMAGAMQRHWRHCVPKTQKPKTSRINLTFRRILS